MATASEAFARQLADEQVATVRRWGDLLTGTTADMRRLADGEIDAPAFGREVTEGLVNEMVLGIESAARLGVEFSHLVSAMVDVDVRSDGTARRARHDE